MGSTADGWWRDKQGAVVRLAGRLRCLQARTGDQVVLVLDVPHPDLPEGDAGFEVHYPRRQGRDAADERILELLDARPSPGTVVVTSDRALADAVRRRGVDVNGARSLLATLDETGCG